jgi:polyhydroxyalkanoate synthesis regulator phasin
MSAERRKVLEMLAEGKITAEDAEKLLDKLAAPGAEPEVAKEKASEESSSEAKKQRYLRIVVDSPDRDQVNLRVPLAFMRTGMKLLAVIPPRVAEKLSAHGIDLSALAAVKGEDLTQVLQELNVNVDRADGKKVRIFCE